MPPAGGHVGAVDGPEPDDLLVRVREHLLRVGLAARVDALVERAQDDLAQVEPAGVGAAGGDQLREEILGDGAAVLGKEMRARIRMKRATYGSLKLRTQPMSL